MQKKPWYKNLRKNEYSVNSVSALLQGSGGNKKPRSKKTDENDIAKERAWSNKKFWKSNLRFELYELYYKVN